ncbi:MAG: carboxylesterase family protein [Akkermansiaceae bacterium]|nr:carboxylesterase family protein [Akkermansiaceae bacterium]
MKRRLNSALTLLLLLIANHGIAQNLRSDIPYVESGHDRQVLDIYSPESAGGKNLPVMFWIHGGGGRLGIKPMSD